jgi:hypothetical protein
MADEITLERDLDEILGAAEPAVPAHVEARAPVAALDEPEDEDEEESDEDSGDDER